MKTYMLRMFLLVGIFSRLILCFPRAGWAQAEMDQSQSESAPFFYFDLVNYKSPQAGKSQLDGYFKIAYDELQFLKNERGAYQAVFEISMVVFDEDDFQTDGKIWRDTVIVDNFDATNSRHDFVFTEASFHLPPSKYRIDARLMDVDTQRNSSQKTTIVLKDFSTTNLMMSDVLIADSVVKDADGRLSASPLVGAPRKQGDKLYAYVEVYSQTQDPLLNLEYEIKNSHNKRVFEDRLTLDKQGKTTYVGIALPSEKMSHDSYVIYLRVKNGKQQVDGERLFAMRWEGIPASVADLELAIQQMRYIAKKDDLKKILEVGTEKQREAFLEFWQRVDPSPGTEENELQDEYYRRINYANSNFSGFQEGWKTDRGMVFVFLGAPDDIERNPFNRSARSVLGRARPIKAYEIWTYHQINRQFIFLDENGYGDYRLEYPFAIDQYLR
jgi:GWxTD domain-containing protein